MSYRERVDQFKRDLLIEVLVQHGGNRSKAAKSLKIPRQWLQYLVRRYAISVPRPARNTYGNFRKTAI